MHVRCATCDAGTELPIGSIDGGAICEPCRRHQALEAARKMGATREERAHRAMEYAAEHGVDLASAYLCLMGIKPVPAPEAAPAPAVDVLPSEPTVEAAPEAVEDEIVIELVDDDVLDRAEAREEDDGVWDLGDVGEIATISIPDLAPAPIPRPTRYDPAFREAVEEGFLTPRQALERGNRSAHAAKLAERYGLQSDLALMLADNRIRLESALQVEDLAVEHKHAPPRQATPFDRRPPRPAYVASLVLAVGVGGFFGARSWLARDPGESVPGAGLPPAPTAPIDPFEPGSSTRTVEAPPSRTPLEHAKFQRVRFSADDTGALTQVSGPNPMSVLEAFCKHPSNRSRFAIEAIVPGNEPKDIERVGVLVDRYRGVCVAVVVSKEAETERWRIGSGQGPIAFLDAPPEITGSLQPPVTAVR